MRQAVAGTNLPLITSVKRVERKIFYNNTRSPPKVILLPGPCQDYKTKPFSKQESYMPGVKLLDRVREQLRLKHYSYRTEGTYLHWIKRYIIFHKKRHPIEMGDDEIRASRSKHLPTILTKEETHNVIGYLSGEYQLLRSTSL